MTMTHAIPTQLTDLEMFEALNLCFHHEKYTSLIPEIVAEGGRREEAETPLAIDLIECDTVIKF